MDNWREGKMRGRLRTIGFIKYTMKKLSEVRGFGK